MKDSYVKEENASGIKNQQPRNSYKKSICWLLVHRLEGSDLAVISFSLHL